MPMVSCRGIVTLYALWIGLNYCHASEVLTLTTDTFDAALSKHPFLVVDFYAPWCGHCKSLEPEWEQAAEMLKGDISAGRPITLAKVDATTEKTLGSRFHVDKFPTIKYFVGGSPDPEEFEGPREAAAIVHHLKKIADPNYKPPPDEVLVLTEDNFDEAVATHPFLVVEFYAPWCGHCKQLDPHYSKAAAILKDAAKVGTGPAITLAKVDGTVQKNLAIKHEVNGYPTIKIFEHGADAPTTYDGPRETDGIVSHLRSLAGPPSAEIHDDAAAETFKSSAAGAAFAVYSGPEVQAWVAMAKEMRGKGLPFAHAASPAARAALGGGEGEGAVLVREFDEGTVRFEGAVSDRGALRDWINKYRLPAGMAVRKGDAKMVQAVFRDDEARPNIYLLLRQPETSDAGRAALEGFRQATLAVRGKMMSVYIELSDFPEVFDHFGMRKFGEPDAVGHVMIEDRKDSLRFLMKGAVTAGAVTEFLAGYEAGTLEPFLKTQPPPPEGSNQGPVRVVVGTTFETEVARGGRWVLLEAYAPWCGHCKKLEPVYEELGLAFAGAKDKFILAKIDATENDLPKSLDVKGFPTILLFRGDGSAPQTYDGDRTLDHLSSFITANTGVKPAATTGGSKKKPHADKADKKPDKEEPKHIQMEAPPGTPSAKAGAGKGAAGAGKGEGSKSLRHAILEGISAYYQVPWMPPGYVVPGLYLVLFVFFLLIVATSALIFVCITSDGEEIPRRRLPAAAAAAAPKSTGSAAAGAGTAAAGGDKQAASKGKTGSGKASKKD